VQAVGTLPNGAKLVLTVHGGGGKISLLQQQMLPGSPRTATPLKIPADLKERINNALAQHHPIMITYVDEAGQPNLTFRGSTQVFSDTQLAICRNASGKMIRSIQKNWKVALKRIQHWCNFLLEHPRTAEGDSRRVLRVQSTSAYPPTLTAKADVPGRSLGHNRKSPARNDMRRQIRFSALPSTANNRIAFGSWTKFADGGGAAKRHPNCPRLRPARQGLRHDRHSSA
jgi:hypothetical protein